MQRAKQAPLYLQFNNPRLTVRAQQWERIGHSVPVTGTVTRTPMKVLSYGKWRRVLKDSEGYYVVFKGERVGITVSALQEVPV